MPAATPASAHAGPLRFGNFDASTEGRPGPRSATAATAAIRTALYSQPPPVTHGPLGACTLRIAVTMLPVISAVATGVDAPSVSSAPPSASDAPAATAWRRPGRSPIDSKPP